MKKISIIVPVYNVGKYIDQCLESICRQTYKNLEIIVVYDESPDDTLQKCQGWAEADSRITLLMNHSRNGLGAARNVGLRAATGDYVAYLDSDDWMDESFIEALYNAIRQTGADYVSGVGYYEVRQGNDVRKNTLLPAGEYGSDDERSLILMGEAPAVWKKLYNRKWLTDNGLFQPEVFHYEDWGFDIASVLQTEKIILVPQIGVYYRFRREGCLSNENIEAICRDFKRSVEIGLDMAEAAGVLERYRVPVQKYLLQDYYMRRKTALLQRNEKALRILDGIRADILKRRLGYEDVEGYERCICFGSLSLRWIVQRTAVFADFDFYGFSSIISAMTAGSAAKVENQNQFRVNQVSNDILGTFGELLTATQERTILFLDFMEERKNILVLENEKYATESEAYSDSAVDGLKVVRRIPSGTDEFISLWKEKCSILVERLSSGGQKADIVLIKNRMALRYGDLNGTVEFDEAQGLGQVNDMLLELEDYFLDACTRRGVPVRVFGLPEQYCFTDRQFKYGCEPQYMNGALYNQVGFEIFKKYGKGRLD